MSANVESMFSVNEVPWHGLGTVLGEYPGSWDEARTLAGLDWEPIVVPSYKFDGLRYDAATDTMVQVHEPGDDVVGDYIQDTGYNRIVHSATNLTLAHKGDSYTLISNQELGEIAEAVLAQPNIKWETAGSLDGGRAVWVLVKLDEPIVLPGDTSATYPYMAITNRHDGQGACSARTTAVRIVCSNTFGAAELEGQKHGAVFSFRHSKNWKDHVEEARIAVKGAREEFHRYEEIATDLLGIPVNAEQRERFVTEFVPMPTITSDRQAANVEEARKAIRDILASKTTAEVSDTAYGLLQASGEYLDHVRRARNAETRFNRTLVRPEPQKARALRIIKEVVA